MVSQTGKSVMESKILNNCPHSCLRVLGMSLILAISAATVQARASEPEDAARTTPGPPWQRVLIGDDAKRVEALENTIGELEQKGQFAEALAPAREVLAIRQRVQGEDHWETVNARITEQTCTRVANLGRDVQSELATAFRQHEQAQELDQRGRYAEAEPLRRSVAETSRRVLGEDHADTAASYGTLALELNEQGKYAEAEPLFLKVLAIYGRTLPESHPDMARSYNNLALNLKLQGKYAEAGLLYQKALTVGRD